MGVKYRSVYHLQRHVLWWIIAASSASGPQVASGNSSAGDTEAMWRERCHGNTCYGVLLREVIDDLAIRANVKRVNSFRGRRKLSVAGRVRTPPPSVPCVYSGPVGDGKQTGAGVGRSPPAFITGIQCFLHRVVENWYRIAAPNTITGESARPRIVEFRVR